ncbi:MAG: T9SS type A sorting domain-containing protein [Chitinophagaceae bacterium]
MPFAIQIDEYRNGVKIESSMRDLTYTFLPGSNNTLPTLSGVNGTNNYYENVFYCTPNTPVSFTVNSADADVNDSTFIEVVSPIANATFTTNTAQNQTGSFMWTPTINDIRPQPYILTLEVKDNKCPFPGIQNRAYLIYVNQCYSDSVWAGDANNDYIVNMYDVLNIGIGNGTSGFVRPNASTNWQAEYCQAWPNTFLSGINYKHADCNGDGTINSADLAAVSLNYGLTHLKNGQNAQQKTLGFPDLYFDVSGVNANQGSTVTIQLFASNAGAPLDNIYGIAGTLVAKNSNTTIPITLNTTLNWMGTASNTLSFTKNTSPNKLDFTLVKTDHLNVSGYGLMGQMMLPISMNDAIGNYITLEFENVRIVNYYGDDITNFNLLSDSVLVQAPVAVNDVHQLGFKIYPNPASTTVTVEFTPKSETSYLYLFDIIGKKVKEIVLPAGASKVEFKVADLVTGVYTYKQINHDISIQTGKLLIQ